MTDQILLKIRELLLNEFSEAELKALCKDIGLDYESLPGTGTFGKTREIMEAVRAQDKLRLLQSRLRELKPEAYADTVGITITPTGNSTNGSAPARQDTTRSPLRAVLLLLTLLALVFAASLIFSGQGNNPAPAAAPQAAMEASVTAPPTPTLEERVSVTQIEGTAAQAMPTIETTVPEIVLPTVTEVSAGNATAMPPATMPPTPELAFSASPEVTVTPNPSETHPAAVTIRQINDQLTLFYLGQASAQDLEYFWMGEALRRVVDFGTNRLPRAMRIRPDQRSALEISHEYLRLPTVVSETANGTVVGSREFWRYANSLNRNQVCEVRDYVYNMMLDGERYRVRSFQSRLVRSGCAD